MFIKSPFNYVGNKYRLLGQILPRFPKEIDTFFDLFCGGLDVSINSIAKKKVANDINHFVIEIFQYLKETAPFEVQREIYSIIDKHKLTKENRETYYAFRDYYNQHKHPLLLFILVTYSFNYQFRFNRDLDYNNPAGTNRSSFNNAIERRLLNIYSRLQDIEFHSLHFKQFDYSQIKIKDFVYADPPYRASVGSYNDGKRGFEGWDITDDLTLFSILDSLHERGIKFALSNVLKNNGHSNNELKEWAKKYTVHYLDMDYSNSSYQKKNRGKTQEVLITNY